MATVSIVQRQSSSFYKTLEHLLTRKLFNFFPPFRGSAPRVTYIAEDWKEVRIKLPLNLRTRNYLGTIYGGSIYAAIDPMYAYMLYRNLGPEYVVWDKIASIHFVRPGRSTLYATFWLGDSEILCIKNDLTSRPSVERIFEVNLVDKDGVVHACIEKTIYVKKKKGG